MTTIQMTPTTVTQKVLSAELVEPEEQERVPAGDLGEVRHHEDVGEEERPAEIQPTHGPNAFVTHVKVVPQSGSTRFME